MRCKKNTEVDSPVKSKYTLHGRSQTVRRLWHIFGLKGNLLLIGVQEASLRTHVWMKCQDVASSVVSFPVTFSIGCCLLTFPRLSLPRLHLCTWMEDGVCPETSLATFLKCQMRSSEVRDGLMKQQSRLPPSLTGTLHQRCIKAEEEVLWWM